MRYPREHKNQARQRLLDIGGGHVKKHGFSGSGMDAIAAAAGVTTGSIYKHFAGKSDLFRAVIASELQHTASRYSAIDPDDPPAVAKSLARYLGIYHVRHPERGCPLPSLTPEVARADESVRATFQAGVLDVHAIVARFAGSSDKAWALLAQNVGAVMIARALLDDGVQRELLAALRREGEALLDRPASAAPSQVKSASMSRSAKDTA